MGHWASFTHTGEHSDKSASDKPFKIEHQQLETTFEKSGNLSGRPRRIHRAAAMALRVVPFDLFRPLRVQSVTADGQPLFFIQEDKNDDGELRSHPSQSP